jgi:hypothetical protein
MLYARGLQGPGYEPTCFDALAVLFKVYDNPPVTINHIKLHR